jgi:O-antigen ligase
MTSVGDYWGYLFATVDGRPANRLPPRLSHAALHSKATGYKPLLAPERSLAGAPIAEWLKVDHSDDEGPHEARIEVWRSWGQTPLRAIAVDALPPDEVPIWPGVAMLVAAVWLAFPLWLWLAGLATSALRRMSPRMADAANLVIGEPGRRWATLASPLGLMLVLAGVLQGHWLVCDLGLLLLAVCGLARPALWQAALLFGLPFYFKYSLPILPSIHINLVDAGVWGSLVLALAFAVLHLWSWREPESRVSTLLLLLLAALASWALVSASAATYMGLALREWRTVFLAGMVLCAALLLTFRNSVDLTQDVALIVGVWLAGAVFASLAALIQYPDPAAVVQAEGVNRLRGFYGSPNNLALYLERTVAVCLALALFSSGWRIRLVALAAALPQLIALTLTFSKGALFVALPIIALTLAMAALWQRRAGPWALGLLAGAAAIIVLLLLPFLQTERLQGALSLNMGTGFLRVNLWRGALQMALDHPLLGVGPDNFLYAYRSGYIMSQAWMEPNLNHPHTWLLDWWTRIGLPGMLLGLAFWGVLAARLVQRMWGSVGSFAINTGILAATLAALAHGLIDVSYALPDLMAVWALFAALASVESRQSPLRS